MISFLLFLLGFGAHLMALFFTFGCGVEAQRRTGDMPDNLALFYVVIVATSTLIGILLIIASTGVS